jgi:hypothetical protein
MNLPINCFNVEAGAAGFKCANEQSFDVYSYSRTRQSGDKTEHSLCGIGQLIKANKSQLVDY